MEFVKTDPNDDGTKHWNTVPFNRVTNLKSEGMQNQSTSVFSVRSTLGKIETTPEIGETLEKVCKIAILNHKQKYKKIAMWPRDCA